MNNIEQAFVDLESWEIEDEKFRVLPNGNGQIFVSVRDVEIKMNVPKSEWAWA